MSDQTTTSAGASYTPGSDAPAPGPVTPVKAASRWEDFVDIFYNPSAVFARRENSGFGIPMLVVTLLIGGIMLLTFNAMQTVMDAEMGRAIATASKQPNFRPEAIPMMKSVANFFARFGGFVGIPVAIFLTGLALWVVGKFVDAKESLNAALMVTAYAFAPRVLASLASVGQALLMDPASQNGVNRLSVGPARFLDPDTASKVAVALASRFDLFTLWSTVLLAIGLSVTGKIPRSKAAIAAIVVWVLGALPVMLQAMRG